MISVLKFLTSLDGRSGRPAMLGITAILLLIVFVRVALEEAGTPSFAVGVLQVLILWPAWVAIPYRRFHDMGRSGHWTLLFWIAAVASFLFLMVDLSAASGRLGLSPFTALADADTYLQTLEAYNASREGQEPMEPVSAIGMGGISLAAIFLIVQFGWLHFIPGQPTENKHGAPVGVPT